LVRLDVAAVVAPRLGEELHLSYTARALCSEALEAALASPRPAALGEHARLAYGLTVGQAEALRWKRTGRGYAIQAGLGAAAAIFFLLLMVMLHVAALIFLARGRDPVYAALIVAGVDLVLLALFGWLAARHANDPVAAEATRVRDDALRQVGDTTARAAMVLPLLRSPSLKKGLIGAVLTAAVVGLVARRSGRA
jgi:hypothetical protein